MRKPYKFYVGDKVEWIAPLTKNKFDCIIKNVKRKDNLIRIVSDHEGTNPMPYSHFYVEPFELKLK